MKNLTTREKRIADAAYSLGYDDGKKQKTYKMSYSELFDLCAKADQFIPCKNCGCIASTHPIPSCKKFISSERKANGGRK